MGVFLKLLYWRVGTQSGRKSRRKCDVKVRCHFGCHSTQSASKPALDSHIEDLHIQIMCTSVREWGVGTANAKRGSKPSTSATNDRSDGSQYDRFSFQLRREFSLDTL
jgi:hypothetical protein